jgi:hypothetical protein
MRRIIGTFFVFCLGAVAMFAAFNIHVVRTNNEWFCLSKETVQFADCYADIRKWNSDEWRKHPDLLKALTKAGRQSIIPTPQELLLDSLNQRVGSAQAVSNSRQ